MKNGRGFAPLFYFKLCVFRGSHYKFYLICISGTVVILILYVFSCHKLIFNDLIVLVLSFLFALLFDSFIGSGIKMAVNNHYLKLNRYKYLVFKNPYKCGYLQGFLMLIL